MTEGVPGSVLLGLVLLAVAAAGGVAMNLAYHLAGVLIPKWLLYLHILLATIGTGLVTWGAWGG